MNVLIYFMISFGAVFTFVLSAGQLLVPKRTIANTILSLFLLSLTVILATAGFGGLLYVHELYEIYGLGISATTVALYCTGPLVYFYFRFILYEHYRVTLKHAVLLLPVTGAVVTVTVRVFSLKGLPDLRYSHVWDILVAGIIYTAIFLTVLLVQHFYILFKSGSHNRPLIINSIALCIYFLLSIAAWFGVNWYAGLMMVSLGIVIIYLLSYRYPQFLQTLKAEAEKVRYAKSKLKDCDIAALKKGLEKLLRVKKVYTDENISLEKVSGALHISRQQLSELINNHYHKSFNVLINEYRIKEAQELLLEDTTNSVLSIAYAVGFNSLSVFYEAFKKVTGVAPKDFRKNETDG